MPQLSLIIAVYKNTDALRLILRGLERQSFRDFEVIIAEDNDGAAMRECVIWAQKTFFFPVKHVSQPDDGFRKDMALNKAVALSAADYLVFIDGDCIPHRHFLKAHFEHREKGFACFGRRVMLSDALSKSLVATADLTKLTFFNLLTSGSQRLDCAFYLPFLPVKIQTTTGIWGCNWSIHKEHLVSVNGFDEDYVRAGVGEDTDIEWRLFARGLRLKKLKFHAIQYHLHHPENYTSTRENEALMAQKMIDNNVYCRNGLDKYLP